MWKHWVIRSGLGLVRLMLQLYKDGENILVPYCQMNTKFSLDTRAVIIDFSEYVNNSGVVVYWRDIRDRFFMHYTILKFNV